MSYPPPRKEKGDLGDRRSVGARSIMLDCGCAVFRDEAGTTGLHGKRQNGNTSDVLIGWGTGVDLQRF